MPNPKTIMVVDDEKAIRELLTEAFSRKGFEVIEAEDGEEALTMAARNNIEVYFIDLLLPEMNGVELCRRLRKAKPTAFMFAMTGYSSVFDLVQCREAGFDDYFPKPFNIEVLSKSAGEAFTKLERWHKSN